MCNISVYCFPLVNRATAVVMLTFPVTRKKVPSHTDLLLEESDRKILEGSGWLNDKIINSYQKLLKKKYAGVTGLQSTLYCEDLKCKPEHSQKLVHWSSSQSVHNIYKVYYLLIAHPTMFYIHLIC